MSSVKFQKITNSAEIRRSINPSFWQEAREYVFYFLKVFVSVAAIYVFIRFSLFDLIGVSGQSMFPNYNEVTADDRIYIDQFTPKFSSYKRGDVVVLIAPEKCDKTRPLYIKRVVGLPGERVLFKDGSVYIKNDDYPDGIVLDEATYLKNTVKTYKDIVGNGREFEEQLLGPDEYFVLGDNRTASMDSRKCGKINKDRILGKEFYRVSPANKAGFFQVPKYNIGNQNY